MLKYPEDEVFAFLKMYKQVGVNEPDVLEKLDKHFAQEKPDASPIASIVPLQAKAESRGKAEQEQGEDADGKAEVLAADGNVPFEP